MLIAIDPGKSGGIAVSRPGKNTECHPMPDTETEFSDCLADWYVESEIEGFEIYAAVEKVGGFIGKGQPGSSMFTFGRGVGVIIGSLISYGIGFVEIHPQTWMKFVGAGTKKGKGLEGGKWKRHLVDLAKKRHPEISKDITLKTADAVLILDWLKAKEL